MDKKFTPLEIFLGACLIILLAGGIGYLILKNQNNGSVSDTNNIEQSLSTSTSDSNPNDNIATTTFYTQSTAIVRSCPNTSCVVLETWPPNSSITLYTPQTLADMPEWQSVSFNKSDYSSGVSKQYNTGYINKINFGIYPVATPSVTANSAPSTAPNKVIPAQNSQPAVNTTNIVSNSPACESIAYEAAQNEISEGVSSNISIPQAHYDSKNGGCFYEFTFSYENNELGHVSVDVIRAAPDDTSIAECTNSSITGVSCYSSTLSNGSISESTFYLIEANLFSN